MAVVFITNAMLTQWSDQGKVRLDDNTLTLLQENRSVTLKPAVRFTTTIDGTPDPNALIGKVKSKDQLTELAAEHYMDSVILGDVGYQVIEGFLGDLSPPQKKAAPAPVEAVAPVEKHEATEKTDADTNEPSGDLEREAEALSKLFLDTVKE